MRTTPTTYGTRLQGKTLAGDVYWEKTFYTTLETYPWYFRNQGKHCKQSILVHHDCRILMDLPVSFLLCEFNFSMLCLNTSHKPYKLFEF